MLEQHFAQKVLNNKMLHTESLKLTTEPMQKRQKNHKQHLKFHPTKKRNAIRYVC